MGAARKIQSEIDRTLKKVQEGIEIFDEIWDKVYEPTTSFAQKERFEQDLKKEIKKLQRYRDQIKAWLSSSDIKDKTELLNGRKSIEREMERFKVCEKEMKTKAFSKEGLGQSAKQDPRERARTEIREWLNTTADTLNLQVDEFESEVEGLANTGKRKSKAPPKLAHFEESINRHRQHVLRLEQMLRLLDNESLSVEEVTETREMVDDYLERNQEDFDEFSNPDDIYEPLLEMLEGLSDTQLPMAAVPHAPASGPAAPKDKEKEKEKDRERAAAAAAKAQLAAHGQIRLEEEEPPVTKKSSASATIQRGSASRPASASIAVPSQQSGGAGHQPHPSGGAAQDGGTSLHGPSAGSSAAGMPPVSPKSGVASPPRRSAAAVLQRHPSPPTPPAQQQQQQQQQTMPGGAPPSIQGFALGQQPGAASGGPPAAPPAAISQPTSSWPFPTASEAVSFSNLRGEALPDSKKRFLSQLEQIQQKGGAAAGSLDGLLGIGGSGSVPASPQQQGGPPFPSAVGSHQSADATPPLEASVVASYEGGKGLDGPAAPGQLRSELQRRASEGSGPAASSSYSTPPHVNPAASLQLLAACAARSIPQQQDSVWQTAAVRTRAPSGGIPAGYPQQKLPILDNPALFEKLDSEALFFSFYYQPGSYQQHLAARELKRQSWRYHKQHGAWFQRHEEPKEATDEFEKGTYVYFDYNIRHQDSQSGWCYRLKQDFTFRYDALEDES